MQVILKKALIVVERKIALLTIQYAVACVEERAYCIYKQQNNKIAGGLSKPIGWQFRPLIAMSQIRESAHTYQTPPVENRFLNSLLTSFLVLHSQTAAITDLWFAG